MYGVGAASALKVARKLFAGAKRPSPQAAIASKLRMRRLWVQTDNQARVLAEDAVHGLREAGYRIVHKDDIGKAVDRGW